MIGRLTTGTKEISSSNICTEVILAFNGVSHPLMFFVVVISEISLIRFIKYWDKRAVRCTTCLSIRSKKIGYISLVGDVIIIIGHKSLSSDCICSSRNIIIRLTHDNRLLHLCRTEITVFLCIIKSMVTITGIISFSISFNAFCARFH